MPAKTIPPQIHCTTFLYKPLMPALLMVLTAFPIQAVRTGDLSWLIAVPIGLGQLLIVLGFAAMCTLLTSWHKMLVDSERKTGKCSVLSGLRDRVFYYVPHLILALRTVCISALEGLCLFLAAGFIPEGGRFPVLAIPCMALFLIANGIWLYRSEIKPPSPNRKA